jgi:protein-disulfide isomerase
MPITRRSLLSVVAATGTAPLWAPTLAHAADADPRMGERSLGKPDAKVTAQEWFSLTCTHCAFFANTVMPEVKTKLIDTGILRIVYKDFPLDRVALMAAMVARALPAERYVPFISALFASQDRWAFARGVNSTDELRKMAALAGMNSATFDATIADKGLQTAILTEQNRAEKQLGVDSTPTFIINGQAHPGAMEFDAFSKLVTAAAG